MNIRDVNLETNPLHRTLRNTLLDTANGTKTTQRAATERNRTDQFTAATQNEGLMGGFLNPAEPNRAENRATAAPANTTAAPGAQTTGGTLQTQTLLEGGSLQNAGNAPTIMREPEGIAVNLMAAPEPERGQGIMQPRNLADEPRNTVFMEAPTAAANENKPADAMAGGEETRSPLTTPNPAQETREGPLGYIMREAERALTRTEQNPMLDLLG